MMVLFFVQSSTLSFLVSLHLYRTPHYLVECIIICPLYFPERSGDRKYSERVLECLVFCALGEFFLPRLQTVAETCTCESDRSFAKGTGEPSSASYYMTSTATHVEHMASIWGAHQ